VWFPLEQDQPLRYGSSHHHHPLLSAALGWWQ
jgi:hypothetical protein